MQFRGFSQENQAMPEVLKLPTVTIEHKDGEIHLKHVMGMTSKIGADRLAAWALGVMRKDLTVKPQGEKK